MKTKTIQEIKKLIEENKVNEDILNQLKSMNVKV